MPVIELPEDAPLPGANTVFFPTFATMLYPQPAEETKRLHWFASAMAGAYSHWQSSGAEDEILSDFHGWIGILWQLTQAPQRVYEDGMDRVSRAGLCGHLLLYLLRIGKHHQKHCRIERARALVVEFSPTAEGKVSDSLIEKAWPVFKAVSPYWAALATMTATGTLTADADTNEEWLAFIGVGEAYRRAAEELRLLLPEETWKAPEGKGVPIVEVEIPPLPPELLAFLDQQFPT